jgi:uncharacterized protein YjdB
MVGASIQLTATPKDAGGTALVRPVSWVSSDTTRVRVNSTGRVTAVAVGTASVTASSEGKTASAALTVTPVPVATVAVSPAAPNIVVGNMVQLTATLRDAAGGILTGRVVTWSSSDSTKAQVSSAGLVLGIAVGGATIRATSEGKTGSAVVTVTAVPVASVTVSPAATTLAVGATVQLTATPRDASGTPLAGRVITWTTSAGAVATVNGSGLVQAQGAGTATITATSEGRAGSAQVTVTGSSAAEVLFQDDFESGAALSSGQGPGDARWGDACCTAGVFTAVAASTAGISAYSGSRVLRIGNPGGALSHWIKATLGGTAQQPRERLHYSVRLYVPGAWTGLVRFMTMRASRDPWGSFGIGGTCPVDVAPQDEFVSASVYGSPVRMYTYWLGMDRGANCTGTTGLFANDTPPASYADVNLDLPRDVWVHVEIELQLNTVGQADGWERIWVNGALLVEHLGVTYRRAATTQLQAITIDSGSHTQAFYMDDIIVRTARP